MKRVAIQGYKGCFHEEAARLFYAEPIEVAECGTFEGLCADVPTLEKALCKIQKLLP